MLYSYRSEGKSDSWNEDWVDHLDFGGVNFVLIADGQQSARSFSSSKFAIDYVKRWIQAHSFANSAQLHYVIHDCFFSLHSHFSMLQGLIGKMFTASFSLMCFLQNGEILVYHVGNCAIYRYRNGVLLKLTPEHTVAADMLSRQEIKPEEYVNHPMRASLSRYLGLTEPTMYDAFRDQMYQDDRYLLMSDGVYRVVDEQEMVEALLQTESPDDARDVLINVAGERQQFDDKTVCICWVN